MLAFQLAHARARDAVHAALDVDSLRSQIDLPTVLVESAAPDRTAYLQNPDLGRRLGRHDLARLRARYDLVLVLADGLSAAAVHAQGPSLIKALTAQLTDWTLAPVVIARQARVALGDPIGEALGARMAVVVIGERPGLSAADSLSAYITFDPKPGRRDSERNCVSNIRTVDGLAFARAAQTIVWLLREARRLGFTGVALKDRQFPLVSDAEVVRAPLLE
jgi:ethanolamine ammonia-lyase small subunit